MLLFGVKCLSGGGGELFLSGNYPKACLIISTAPISKGRIRMENKQQKQKADSKK